MSLAEMQACLARLYVDSDFRKAVSASDHVLATGYRLSANERDALLALDQHSLGLVAIIVEQKRRERLGQRFPATLALAPSLVRQTLHSYCHRSPGSSARDERSDAIGLGEALALAIANDSTVAAYVAAVLAYERARLASEHSSGSPARTYVGPRLRADVSVHCFEYDVITLYQQAIKGQLPPTALPGEHWIALVKGDLNEPRVFRLNRDTAELLDRCDGCTDSVAIAASFGAGADVLAEVSVTIDELVQIGLLEVPTS